MSTTKAATQITYAFKRSPHIVDSCNKIFSLQQENKTTNSAELHFVSTTRTESLQIKELLPNCPTDTLEATHYVAGITYGGDAHIVFKHVSNF